jgi:copper chaperone NosL
MILADHLGPKGQVILEAGEDTLWFSSARDTLAFLMLPEEPKRMDAVYVSDMGAAPWDHPEKSRDAWVDARDAWYVIGSSKSGGMGQAEAVPFSDEEAARRFSLEYGGDVLRYAEIAPEHILGSQ